MNLSDLIHEIWKDERVRALRIRKSEVKVIMRVAVDKIREMVIEHGRLKMENLFTIEVRKIKGRKIGAFGKNKHRKMSDYNKVAITPSRKLKDGVNPKDD